MLAEAEVKTANTSYKEIRKKISDDIKEILAETKTPISLLAHKLELSESEVIKIIDKKDLTVSLLITILSLVGSEPYFLIRANRFDYSNDLD